MNDQSDYPSQVSPDNELMRVRCSNCGSLWKVTPGPLFNPEDLSTYPNNDACPYCAEETFDFIDPNESRDLDKYTPDE